MDKTLEPHLLVSPRIDLQQLRFAIAATDSGSIRRAAEVLSISHSILSRSIRQLEHRIGARIFERSRKGVRPTSTGHTILRMARSVLNQVDAIVATAKSTGRGSVGRLSIGFSTALSSRNLRAMLIEFRSRYPRTELAMMERSRIQLEWALRNGAVDIAIMTGRDPLVESNILPLWDERVLITLPEDHRLTAAGDVCWNDLREETVLFGQHDSGRELEELLIATRFSSARQPRIERHDVSRGVIKNLVSMKLGISLVWESDEDSGFTGIVYRGLRDAAGPTGVGISAYWRHRNENQTLENFLKLLAERYQPPGRT